MNYIKRFSNINKAAFHQENAEQGSSLIVVLVMMATMLAIAFGAIQVTQLNVASSGAHKKGKQSFYSTEFGLDQGVDDIIQEFENLSVYTTTADKGGSPGITKSYRGYDVTYNITNPLDRFLYRTVVGNGTIFHYAHTFNIDSVAISTSDNTRDSLTETLRILETPLVQYFAFYAGTGDLADLELYPGADMNIWGRMHANRQMYIVGRNNDIVIRNYDQSNNFSPHFMTMGGNFRGDQKHNTSTWSDTDTFIRTNNNLTIIGSPTTSGEFREIPLLINAGNEATQEPLFNNFLNVQESEYQAPDQTQF